MWRGADGAGGLGVGTAGRPVAPFDEGTLIGKRYVDEDERSRCCARSPAPARCRSGTRPDVKDAKPLPVLRLRRAVHLGMVLEMAADGMADRVAVGSREEG